MKFKLIMVILLGGIFVVGAKYPWIAAGLGVLWFIGYIFFIQYRRKS